jgi:osmoprotectant transport system ATP-binding protein
VFEVENVSKAYAGTPALRPTTLRFERGRTTALLGPSGSGKSTLLRLLVGLVAPDAGVVRFDGVVMHPSSARALRRRMGYVIQEGGLFPHLTAAANVALLPRHVGWTRDATAARIDELGSLVRLDRPLLARFPSELSGGQRQRVALLRALVLDPDALLLDEPLGSLDPMIRADLQDDLRSIFTRLGKTVVIVTHDVGEAAVLADHVVLLRDGGVVQQGTLASLIERPVDPFVSRFVAAQRVALPGPATTPPA